MATLTANISASATIFEVSAPVDNGHYTIDDEAMYVHGTSRGADGRAFDRKYITVDRAIAGTTAATHLSGATLTRYYPDAAGGGGSAIAATDTQVVFMDGTDAVGSEHLTWLDGANPELALAAGENASATIQTIGVGAQLALRASDGDASHVGGEISINSGLSDGFGGGNILITAGPDSGGGDGGDITIASGWATDGESGSIDLRAGGSGTGATGGAVNIVAGTGMTGSGGSVIIQAGPKVTGGSHGTIQLYSAEGSHSLELSETLGFIFGGGVVRMAGLPTADPVIAGAFWVDVAAGRVLKVSAG